MSGRCASTVLDALGTTLLSAAVLVGVEVEGKRGVLGKRTALLSGGVLGVILPEEGKENKHLGVRRFRCATTVHYKEMYSLKYHVGGGL